ncbi:MAG TPA: enoyl-CoA hydratase [bacterium]|nr:enoyl-CoA hydratase [bacterium]
MASASAVAQAPLEAASLVQCEVSEGIGHITLNHPQKRNALSRAMLEALRQALQQQGADPAVRVIVLAGNGPVFSSGHDLKEFVGADPDSVTSLLKLCTQVMELPRQLPKPVIAQVAGLASAAGCQLAASCDLVLASSQAHFQTPGVNIGLFCSTPMVPLSRAVPPKKAMEMLLTGQAITAQEAERAGLVSRVVAPERLAQETQAMARHIASFSAETLALGKQAFYRQLPLEISAAYGVGQEAMLHNSQMQDAQEGMTAFLQKRPPHWHS